MVEMLRDYDAEQHEVEPGERALVYAVLILLQLLPSSSTRHKAKLSAAELDRALITFKPQQTSLALFLAEKTSLQKQPFLLCIGSKDINALSHIYYLILDTKAICLGPCGVLRAVDALFKSHYVYWVDYA